MPPHYSPRSFLRQAPKDLLARYFESRGLSFKPDFATVADTRPDPLYAAWLQFPEEQAQRDGDRFSRDLQDELPKGRSGRSR